MSQGNFFSELKRRNVYRVAVAYAVVAWLLIQIATQVFPFFDIPNWAVRLVVLLLALGFPVAVILAWAFERTAEGIQLTADGRSEGALRNRMRRPVFWSLIAIGAVAASLLSFHFLRPASVARMKEAGQSPSVRRAVAVLPFDNLSDDKANAYFADGMQDEIITRLAKIGDLKVISRASTLPYRTKPAKISEIARQLGVHHIVEGSVQRSGDRVRVNVQLVEAETDEHLWAELYDRHLTDIFAVQSEVATAIAKALRAKLSPREQNAVTEKPTTNLAAYDAYLRGLQFYSQPGEVQETSKRAAEAFAEAVRLDPQFAQAWARLSRANASMYFLQVDASAPRKEAARAAAENATRLAPGAAETLFANAYYRYHVERDYAGARDLFETILRDVPSSSEAIGALAKIARRQSRWKDSLRLYDEAAKLNPRDAQHVMDWAWTYSMLREHAATERTIDQALALVPNDATVLQNKVILYQNTGRLAEARAILDSIPSEAAQADLTNIRIIQLTLERRYEEAARLREKQIGEHTNPGPGAGGDDWQSLSYLRWLAGDVERAKEAALESKKRLQIQERDQPRNPWIVVSLAQCEAVLGNKDAALREGERAVSVLPASRDPVTGPLIEETLARVEAQVGETERAINRIERLLVTPCGAFPVTQALLRIDPSWDGLRAHPRFKALVEGPEPKTIYN